MSKAVVAKRDTYINLMRDIDVETFIPKGTWMFHVTDEKTAKYLDPGEICIYLPEYGTNFSYEGDWEEYALP